MPTLTTLDEAMLRPRRQAPAIARLGGGTVVTVAPDQPWRIVGSEAVVYQLRRPDGSLLALRTPLADRIDPALASRLQALSQETDRRDRRGKAGSPFAKDLDWFDDGLALMGGDLKSRVHPLLAMEWFTGPTLIDAVERASRGGERGDVLLLAEQWLDLANRLTALGWVHGDLSGDNAIVRPRGGIALVDYDRVWWPDSPNEPQPAVSPGYTHPRGPAKRVEWRDHFTELVIYTSLLAIAAAPDLRERHGDPVSQRGAALLFTQRDLAQPDHSPLFKYLRGIAEFRVRDFADLLAHACSVPADDVPPLAEVVRAVSRPASRRPAVRPEVSSLEQSGDLEGAGPIAPLPPLKRERPQKQEPQPAEPEPTPIAEWPQRQPARATTPAPRINDPLTILKRAVADGDAALIARVWPDARALPGAAIYATAASEAIAGLLRARVAGAIERGDDPALLAAIADCERDGVALTEEWRVAGREAARREAAVARLRAAIDADDRPALTAMAFGGELDDLGSFTPEVEQIIRRAIATVNLTRAVDDDDDAAIARIFNAELFADDKHLNSTVRERAELARARVAWLAKVRKALRARDASALSKQMIEAPAGAEALLSAAERRRIGRLLEHNAARNRLTTAILRGNDAAIIAAFEDAERLGVTLPEELDWPAIRAAQARLRAVGALRSASQADPLDLAELARCLAEVRELLGDVDLLLTHGISVAELEASVRQGAQRARLIEAIDADDDRAIIAAASPDPFGAVSTLEERDRVRVEQAFAQVDG